MPVVDCLASLAFLLSNGGYQQRMDAILALQGLVYDDTPTTKTTRAWPWRRT